jgi:DNA-binding NarL/FixJ family response regulator
VFEHLRADRLGKITAREIQVLYYLGAGLDHEDIATTLGIATATVDDHVRHIRNKVGEADNEGKAWLGGGDTRLLALRLPELPGNQDEA